MRILHVLDHSIPLHSGYTFRTRAILTQQRARGWHTEHLTSVKQGRVSQLRESVDELTFHRCRPLPSWLSRVPVLNQIAVIWRTYRRLLELAPALEPDVLHAHSPALNGVAAVLAGRKLDVPVVYEVRAFWEDAAVDHGTSREGGWRYRLTRAMESWVLRRAQAVTTICQGLRNDIINRGIDENKVTVIPNAVDLAHFNAHPPRDLELADSLGLGDKVVLGFAGSFYAYEGLDLLLEGFARVYRRLPAARLLLVGGGDQRAALEHLAHTLGIAEQVIFTGRVPHSDVGRYYSLIDILVYPRKPMRLTELVTPLKPLEAMAQNKLVVASDVGGHKELIRDGINGVLFKSEDVEDLAGKLVQLMQQPESWPHYTAAGYDYVANERNWPVSVSNYQQVYGALR